MAPMRNVVPPNKENIESHQIRNNTSLPNASEKLTVSFSKFKFTSIRIRKEFNNYFKDKEHYIEVSSGFIGTVLPNITSYSYNELCEGTRDGEELHFHPVDDKHQEIIRKILNAYGFSETYINQMLDGNNVFMCSAVLGHEYPARVVFHKVDNVLEILFFDTNHHIYFNEKYLRESLFYEDCPKYNSNECVYMPGDCFAVGLLDENKLKDSYGFDCDVTSPPC